MDTLMVMRMDDFPLAESHCIPAFAEHIDAFAFLCRPEDSERISRLSRHPKCVVLKIEQQRFRNATSQLEALLMAQEFNPRYVAAFDSDELPPGRFAEEFARFKALGLWSMDMMNFECWGDPLHIVADFPYKAPPHCRVMRWEKGLNPGAYHKAHRFRFWCDKSLYKCDYPVRHLAFMTPEIRERRRQRGLSASHKSNWKREAEGPGAWSLVEHPTIPYDPDMTWKQYLEQSEQWKRSA